MESKARYEFLVVGGLIVVLLLGVSFSMREARREKRDGLRRQGLIEQKIAIEQVNNELGYYPIDFNAGVYEFVVLEGNDVRTTHWYLRTMLERPGIERAGFDEEYNVFYRTGVENGVPFYDICGSEFHCGVERTE